MNTELEICWSTIADLKQAIGDANKAMKNCDPLKDWGHENIKPEHLGSRVNALCRSYSYAVESMVRLSDERDQLAAQLNEVHTDENGTAWTRPTAWAYMQVCKARDKHAERARAIEQERDTWKANCAEAIRQLAEEEQRVKALEDALKRSQRWNCGRPDTATITGSMIVAEYDADMELIKQAITDKP